MGGLAISGTFEKPLAKRGNLVYSNHLVFCLEFGGSHFQTNDREMFALYARETQK